MSEKEQVALFQHQYYEWMQFKSVVGQSFFPESYWVRSDRFTEDEAHDFYKNPGKGANTFKQYIKVQLDRHLRDRYSSDDE